MGAIATGGVCVLNDEIVRVLRIPNNLINAVVTQEQHELERRERLYRGDRPPRDVRGRTVILVDDGLATGPLCMPVCRHSGIATATACPHHRRSSPTASPESSEELRTKVDEVICGITPELFYAVGLWYEDFSQTTDEEVRDLLARSEYAGHRHNDLIQ
jgi:putative phosphoribosyl transferase